MLRDREWDELMKIGTSNPEKNNWKRGMGSSASNKIFPFQVLKWPPYYNTTITKPSIISFAAPTASLLPKSCRNCGGKGAIDCPGCKVNYHPPSTSYFINSYVVYSKLKFMIIKGKQM